MKKILTIKNFALLVIFCAPTYLIKVTFFDLPTNIFEILLIFTFLLIFIKKRNLLLREFLSMPKILTLPGALIFFGLISSIIANGNFLAGLGILKGWFLIPIIFSFALYLISDSVDFLEKIYQSIFFSTALIALIALVYNLLGILTYDNRLTAFYLSPNHLAMYLAVGFFFGLYFLQKSFLQNRFSRETFIYFTLLLLILISLYFTYSYGAWLAILGSTIITLFIILKNKKEFLWSFLLLLSCAITLFFFQSNTQKFSDTTNLSSRSSSASRIMIWNTSLLMLKQNPILGIGPGNFQNTYLEYQKYFPPYLEWAVPQPHNLYLAFWLQTGLAGFVGFLLLLFYIFKTLIRSILNEKSAALAAPLFGFFLYTCVHGLIDTPFWKNDLAFLFWLCVFLTISLQKYLKKSMPI